MAPVALDLPGPSRRIRVEPIAPPVPVSPPVEPARPAPAPARAPGAPAEEPVRAVAPALQAA